MNKRQTFCQPIAAASPLKNPQAIKDTEDETNKTNAQPESFELKLEATTSAAITPEIPPYH
jgi:hypothetical protein